MGNATRWDSIQQVVCVSLILLLCVTTVLWARDLTLPVFGLSGWVHLGLGWAKVVWLSFLVISVFLAFGFDLVFGPRAHLVFLVFMDEKDDKKASSLSAWCRRLTRKAELGISIHQDLLWIEQYLSKNFSNTMNRGTLTGVEDLCKKALEMKREDPGVCLSIYQLILSKTNRGSEITGLWTRYASVPGVASCIETLKQSAA